MLASTLGIEFDVDQSWDEREKLFKLSGKIVRTTNITQSAVIEKNGEWATVLAAAVFVLRDANGQNASSQQSGENDVAHPKASASAPASPPAQIKTA